MITLSPFRKKAAISAKHHYLNMILTTIDHLRSNQYIKLMSLDKSEYSLHINQIRKQGYSIIHNYINSELCHQYREEVNHIINNYPQYLHKNIEDQRIYGAENISTKIKSFSSDSFLQKIATTYNHKKTRAAFTLAAKLPYSLSNNGSGGGWHRDSCIKQFKAILYLSDVSEKNGPFQLVSHSNNLKFKLLDNKQVNQPCMAYRYTNNQIEKIIGINPERLITFCAPAGTLILVDTSCIHRGKPIEEGNRYTLFNYYYPIKQINNELLKQFSPLAQL